VGQHYKLKENAFLVIIYQLFCKGSSSNCDTGYTSFTINIHSAFTSKRRAGRVGGVEDSEFGSDGVFEQSFNLDLLLT
jgi:hypothetical protein